MARGYRVVLDSGALSAISTSPVQLRALLQSQFDGVLEFVVPSVVLAESLTETPRDARTNAALALMTIVDIDEPIARAAAKIRHARRLRRASTIDALVVACADHELGSVIVTGDPEDLRPLASEHARSRVISIN